MPAYEVTMSLIDAFMPDYSLREIHRVAVATPPARAYQVLRSIDMYRLSFVKHLFKLRTLPDRVWGKLRSEPIILPTTSCIDDITKTTSGFMILGEDPGCEVVVGAVGKFWQPVIRYAHVSSAGFAKFSDPGFGKVAWSLRVDPHASGGSWISLDLRVNATDAVSLARFKRYWLLIGRFSQAIRRSLLKTVTTDLGPALPDDWRPLPGDEILSANKVQKTHAVVLEASPHHVWPWLIQMGAERGGWYSFDSLDNGGRPSATHIIAGLQHLSVGDIIPALPKSKEGFAVLRIEPERELILGSSSLLPGSPKDSSGWGTTWAFVLEPIGSDATHLVVRVRANYDPSFKMTLLTPLIGIVHEIMERRQLYNLRRRTQGATV